MSRVAWASRGVRYAPPPEYCTLDDVLQRLRIGTGHPDAGYAGTCHEAACELIGAYLEHTAETDPVPIPDPIPSALRRAAIGVTIRIYRFKDQDSDISDTWGDEGMLRIPRNPLAGYTDLMGPYKHRFGFG